MGDTGDKEDIEETQQTSRGEKMIKHEIPPINYLQYATPGTRFDNGEADVTKMQD